MNRFTLSMFFLLLPCVSYAGGVLYETLPKNAEPPKDFSCPEGTFGAFVGPLTIGGIEAYCSPCDEGKSAYMNNYPRFMDECLACGREIVDGYCRLKCKENSFYGLKIEENDEKYGCYDCNDEEIFIFADIDECSKCSDRTLLVWKGPTPENGVSRLIWDSDSGKYTDNITSRKKVSGTCVTNEFYLEIESKKNKK